MTTHRPVGGATGENSRQLAASIALPGSARAGMTRLGGEQTSYQKLTSEHVFGLRQAVGAVQPHRRVDGTEGLQHADALEPLVDGAQLERPARCGGERGVLEQGPLQPPRVVRLHQPLTLRPAHLEGAVVEGAW
eukprot:scaffold12080_cov67-Phaeocystis_antarctica.AAC.4